MRQGCLHCPVADAVTVSMPRDDLLHITVASSPATVEIRDSKSHVSGVAPTFCETFLLSCVSVLLPNSDK